MHGVIVPYQGLPCIVELQHSKLHIGYCMVEVHRMMLHCAKKKYTIVVCIVHVESVPHQDAKLKLDGRSAPNHGTLSMVDMLYTKVHGS